MNKTPSRYHSLWMALNLAWELGYVIALPLVILALLGRWLDRRWGSSPLMILVGVVTAFIITSIWLSTKIKEVTNELKNEGTEEHNKES